MNKLNLSFFKKEKVLEQEEKIIFRNQIDNNLLLIKNDQAFNWEFSGFKIIKTLNTNKTIKNLLYKNEIESLIKINDLSIRTKDIIIISSFSKVSDILNTRVNGNTHSYLKERKLFEINSRIENIILNELNNLDFSLQNVLDYNLSKADIINFLDVKNEFISEKNLFDVLNILKNYNSKQLVIFNDVDFVDFEKLEAFLPFFNFLYFVNSIDEEYKKIQNYLEFLIEFDFL